MSSRRRRPDLWLCCSALGWSLIAVRTPELRRRGSGRWPSWQALHSRGLPTGCHRDSTSDVIQCLVLFACGLGSQNSLGLGSCFCLDTLDSAFFSILGLDVSLCFFLISPQQNSWLPPVLPCSLYLQTFARAPQSFLHSVPHLLMAHSWGQEPWLWSPSV